MRNSSRHRLEGLRWLLLAFAPSDLRARHDAIEWLRNEPVFAYRRTQGTTPAPGVAQVA